MPTILRSNDFPLVAQASPALLRFLESLGLLPTQYAVTVTNNTTDVFTELDCFYKRRNLPGVVFLQHTQFTPGETVLFSLGNCPEMESYVLGFFIGEDLVAQWPPAGSGNITPDNAWTYNPSDTNPCEDSWSIS